MRGLTTEEFDAFVDGLDYPMFVVTAYDGAERAGCLVGFATQVSIDPPRFLVCLSRANHTFGVAARADVLAVHALHAADHPLAAHFGGETGDDVDKFADVSWHTGPDGVPLLAELPRRLVGKVAERVPFGDHVGYVLVPIAEHGSARDGAGDPLMLGDVDDVTPGHPA